MIFLLIDVGTSYTKFTTMSYEGKFLSQVSRVETSKNPFECIQNIIKNHSNITHISISSYSPAIVLLDENLKILDSSNWFDDKSEKVDTFSFYIPKILWFLKNNPQAYQNSKYILPYPEYFYFMLSGDFVVNSGDIKYLWQDFELEKFGLNKEKLPKIKDKINFCKVKNNIALKLGLSKDTLIVNSGIDYIASQIGSGAIEDGYICNRIGTSEGINYFSNYKNSFSDDFLYQKNLIKDNHILMSKIINYSGELINNFVKTFKITDIDDFITSIDIKKEYKKIKVTRPKLDKGGFVDFSNLLSINFEEDKKVILLNILISVFFCTRLFVKELQKQNLPIFDIRCVGRLSKNETFNKIKAMVVKKNISVLQIQECELLGSFLNIRYIFDKEYRQNDFVKVKSQFEFEENFVEEIFQTFE